MAIKGQGGTDDRAGAVLVRSSPDRDLRGQAACGVRRKKILPGLLLILLSVSPSFAAQNQQIAKKLIALENIKGKFTFVVFGDNRSGDDIYRKIISLAMERKPDFIINTGDMIMTPGDTQQWENFWAMSKPVTVPYFLVVGNHDAHPMMASSEMTYREQVDLPQNEIYYSFTAGNSLFVILDSNRDDQKKRITGEQLKWLEGILSNSLKKHTFVFLHHPLYTEPEQGHHAGDSLDRYTKERDTLEALFMKSKVDAVFAGHEHYYKRKTVDGIVFIITGGGGAPLYSKEEDGGFHHFVQVTVNGDKVSAEVVDVNGKVRDRF